MIEIELKNSNKIPIVGYGTWKLKNNEETEDIIKNALECGYRLIDTASAYGNEEAIGKGIKKAGIDRSKLFISGKLWNSEKTDTNTIVNACLKTIEKLNCDYLDLYLIHWPASKAVHDDWASLNASTWKAFEYLYKKGIVKAIGVCNFKVNQLEELKKVATIMPMVNQIEYHIGIGDKQDDVINYCRENDIVLEAWSPLGSGKVLKNEIVQQMADKYGVSIANICIKYCIQNDILPLPKSKNEDRMKANLNIDFEISKEDMEILKNIENVGCSGLDSEEITIFG